MKQKTKPSRIFSWSLTKRIENQYRRDLVAISKEVDKIVKNYLFVNKPNFGAKLKIADIRGLEIKLKQYSARIVDWGKASVGRMIGSLEKSDLSSWERHSKEISNLLRRELSKGEIHDRMKAYMDDNVDLITSLPLKAAERVHHLVNNNLKTGARAETLIAELLQTGKVTESQARTIARTETSRAATGLVKASAESIDIDWYFWRTTHDNRLRKSHKIMDGVLCRWDDPPSPELLAGEKSVGNYLPGAIWNCRCYAEPLILISDIKFPVKVYTNGSIKKMNREQFMKLTNYKYEEAA